MTTVSPAQDSVSCVHRNKTWLLAIDSKTTMWVPTDREFVHLR